VKLAFSNILLFLDNPLRLLGRFMSGTLGDFACVLRGARGAPRRCSKVSRIRDFLARCPSLDLAWVVCTRSRAKLLQYRRPSACGLI
jgi:hypothetical protein